MQRRFFLVAPLVVLSGCGGRLNPFNWFKRRPQVVDETGFTAPVDPRGLIARVTEVKVEPTSTGLILRATGIAATQGFYDAELVGLPVDDKGVRTFEFRVSEPGPGMAAGPAPSRSIVAAAALSFFQLEQVSALRVAAAENAVIVRP